jgi:putative salt-induced outer membrane protein YdiY
MSQVSFAVAAVYGYLLTLNSLENDLMDLSVRRLLSPLICLLFPVGGVADEVYLKNGDHLTGTVKTTKDGKLILETSYSGEIGIALAEIQRVSTDKPVTVQLSDDSQLTGILSATESAEMRIAADADAVPQPVAMAQIAAISVPEIPGLKIRGQANAGLDLNRGNTDQDTYHADAESIFRWPDDRVTLGGSGDLEKSNGDKTKQQATLGGKYDRFLSKQWYLYSGLGFEHDKFADLTLRTTVSAGSGYQIYETERTNLSIEAGPAYIWEDFDKGKDDDYAAAHWGLRFDHFLVEAWKLQVFHRHTVDWSVEDASAYLFKSATGLRIPIFDSLQATAQVNFDRDNDPAPGAKKNDYEYLLTGGYAW